MAPETLDSRPGPAANNCPRTLRGTGREDGQIDGSVGPDCLPAGFRNSSRSLIDLEEAARKAVSVRVGHVLGDEEWKRQRLRLMELAGIVRSWKPPQSAPALSNRSSLIGVIQRAQINPDMGPGEQTEAAPGERFHSVVFPSRKAA